MFVSDYDVLTKSLSNAQTVDRLWGPGLLLDTSVSPALVTVHRAPSSLISHTQSHFGHRTVKS